MEPNSEVRIRLTDGRVIEGIVMQPHLFTGHDIVVLKLKNGYNIGISKRDIAGWEVIGEVEQRRWEEAFERRTAGSGDRVSVIVTGGTILSRVDYRTGGVYPSLDPDYLFELVPELEGLASVTVVPLFSKFSEDMMPTDWTAIANAVESELDRGAVGVVVMHGTDTMHYSAAALAFALRAGPGPVVFVGAQRSSDRPSSDAYENLLGAIITARAAPFAESVVAMHGGMDDGVIAIHRGTRVRKMHTSRRDTFTAVNDVPLAHVDVEKGDLRLLTSDYRERDSRVLVRPAFSDRAALIKYYPGMPPQLLDALVEMGVRGIVLEGTGFGHVGEQLLDSLKRAIDVGVHVFMTSQTLFGRVNLRVYSRGRELLRLGVMPLEDMAPEVAYVKLAWALANYPVDRVPEVMATPLAYEISYTSRPDAFTKCG